MRTAEQVGRERSARVEPARSALRQVALVDWLGRGGIAQTTEAWVDALATAPGLRASVLTRAGREIRADGPGGTYPARSGPVGGLRAHDLLTRRVAQWIIDHRPDVLVVQDSLVPILERRVHEAARRVGAEVVLVVHDHRPHSPLSGNHAGFARLVHGADAVVCHTAYVADRLAHRHRGVAPRIVPHPLPIGLLAAERPERVLPPDDRPTALHLGVLKRRYKGADIGVALAGATPSWRFAFVGAGAPECTSAVCIRGFRPPGELVQSVADSDVVILPYRRATQSGVVVLAHAVGAVPIVHAVGGLPEQVRDGVDGRVLPVGSDVSRWQRALTELRDPDVRAELAARGFEARAQDDRRFRSDAVDLVR